MSTPHVQAVKMSAPPGHQERGDRTQAARSSRRKVGSTGPQVVLGGGAGVYGSSMAQADARYSHTFQTSPHTFPVQFPSPSSATFPSPISPLIPNMYRAPSPLPPQLTESNATTKSPDISRDRDSNVAMGSISSLSTAASTSSRTLKTPHSKLDHLTHVHQPSIVSSSDSHDSTASNGYETSPLPALPKERAVQRDDEEGSARSRASKEQREQRSPTPTQRTISKTTRDANTQPGEMGRPDLTSSRSTSATRTKDRARSAKPRGSTPPHLNLTKANKANHRLSQDWVQIDFPAPVMQAPRSRALQEPNLSTSPENGDGRPRNTRSQSHQGGLPEAVMVPMKGDQSRDSTRDRSASISRPPFERTSTAPRPPPPAGSDPIDPSRPQRKGRGSLGQLRSNSSTEVPGNQRTRKNSHSTPPSVILESTVVGKFNPFKSAKPSATAAGSDATDPNASSDPSRTELSARQAELKATRQEQQRSLGVSAGRASRDQDRSISIEMERKSSGLSMKKSTGALKALFNRGVSGKGKERAETPPLPPNATEQRDKLKNDLPLPARPSTSNTTLSPHRSVSRDGRTSPGSPTPPGKHRPGPQRYESDIIPARPSFTSDRGMYPALPLNRAKSHGASGEPASMPMVESRSESSAQPYSHQSPVGLSRLQPPAPDRRLPDRDLPPLPPSSPNPSATNSLETPSYSATDKSSGSSSGSYTTAREHSPAASTDPMSAASSKKRQGELTPDPSPGLYHAEPRPDQSAARIPPSSSLHLLQLPSLDLDFDLSFDKIGVSPTTPRHRSPGNRRSPHSPHSPTPQRSLTTKVSSTRQSPALRRQNSDMILDRSERRRSKSFDGPTSGTILGDIWRDIGQGGAFTSPSMAKLFASSSNSAPVFSVPLEATSSDDSVLSNSTSSSSTVTPQPTNQPSRSELEQGRTATAVPAHVSRTARRQDSGASSRSGPSSSDHARTPSNTSSTHDTESPSPPRTPPPHNASVRDYGYTYESSPSAPTPKALSLVTHDLDQGNLQQPILLSLPPSIPLPPAPGQDEAPATPPKPTTALTTPKTSKAELPTTPPKDRTTTEEDVVVVPRTVPAGPLAAGVAPPTTRPPTKVEDSPKPEEDDSHLRPVGGPTIISVKPARSWKPSIGQRAKVIVPDDRSLRALVKGLEDIVHSFCAPASIISAPDRCNLIRTQLLPLLGEIEKRPHAPREESTNRALREVVFDWAESLLYELRVEQAASERGACLEGLSAVMESSCLSEVALTNDEQHKVRFINLMIKCMKFVMGKLGAKGVFHNTLLFSGRFLAFVFFRIPHIAEQLITVLQLPRGALMRFTRAAMLGPAVSAHAVPRYPKHLLPLCFDTCSNYITRLASLSADFKTDEERDAFLFTPGNWLRRWQSDDSELFPAFYRAYHRQLALYLSPTIEHYETLNEPVPLQILLRAPGYAHLATVFAKKCHAYILGSINAVTTSSSTQGFDATESAGIKASQKPAVLETANRRLTETISTLINGHIVLPDSKGRMVECDGQQLWSSILDLWTKSLIGKTSLYAPKGVFSLFDLLDGIVDPPHDPLTGERRLKEVSLLDVPHLIHVIRLVLHQAEHALTIVKVAAFVFTHWEVLTARSEDRKELCLGLLLEKELFERLTLFWSQSVRSYVLRLVVFRLAHVHTTKEDGINHDVEIDSVRLLQTRLERIRKRYNELEPKDANTPVDRGDSPYLGSSIDGLPRSRSTITMITDSPRGQSNKAERLLGLGLGSVDKGMSSLEVDDTSRMGKAKGWLKKSFANKKKKSLSPALSSSTSTSPSNSPRLSPSPQMENTGTVASPNLNLRTPPVVSERKSPRPSLDSAQPPARAPNSSRSKSTPAAILSLDSPELEEYSPPRRLPTISASDEDSPGGVAFEFELPTMSPRSDTFDPTPTPSSPRRNSQPPSPRGPTSPHMSRSFSKRSSLLPPNTASILANELASPGSSRAEAKADKGEEGYPRKLHAYAIRMLAELEDAQKEYDEWWAPGGVGTVDGAPPRLTVAWPFHEGDE